MCDLEVKEVITEKTVEKDDAIEMAKKSAREEGLLIGISSGASLFASIELSKKYPDKNIVVLLPDTGERYLSIF